MQDQVDPQEPSQAEEDAAEPAPEETETPKETETPEETPEPTEEPPPGVEDSAGKCFPKGYEPGDPWPGYPGNPDAPAGTEQGTGAGAGTGAGQ